MEVSSFRSGQATPPLILTWFFSSSLSIHSLFQVIDPIQHPSSFLEWLNAHHYPRTEVLKSDGCRVAALDMSQYSSAE